MAKNENEIIPTRHSLLSRLKDWEDGESWQEFFNIYWKLIYATALKAGLKDDEAQEVVQETVISVSKSMPGFQYRSQDGSFKHWLMNLTNWRIHDQFRKRPPYFNTNNNQASDDSEGADSVSRLPDPKGYIPSEVWEEEWEKNLLEVVLSRIKNTIDPLKFQIFDLYVLKDLPVKKVSELLKVNTSMIYLTKHRINSLVKRELKKLRKEMPQISNED